MCTYIMRQCSYVIMFMCTLQQVPQPTHASSYRCPHVRALTCARPHTAPMSECVHRDSGCPITLRVHTCAPCCTCLSSQTHAVQSPTGAHTDTQTLGAVVGIETSRSLELLPGGPRLPMPTVQQLSSTEPSDCWIRNAAADTLPDFQGPLLGLFLTTTGSTASSWAAAGLEAALS